MEAVNLSQAKSTLSRLVKAIEHGREREIVIARRGRPAARLVPLENVSTAKRIGVAKGAFRMPDPIDALNKEVAEQFIEGGSS